MEKYDRLGNVWKDFKKVMKKHGFTELLAYEMDSGTEVHGPFFGEIPNESGKHVLMVSFSLRGENACPCCIENETKGN